MTKLPVERVKGQEMLPMPVFEEMRQFMNRVRDRAFDLFLDRTGKVIHELDDWFRAERELLGFTPMELVEKPEAFVLRVGVPGVSSERIQVTALPQEIIVRTEVPPPEETPDQKVLVKEFRSEKTFRRVQLPAAIDIDKVTATLKDGLLEVVAVKMTPAKVEEKKIDVVTEKAEAPKAAAAGAAP
jgi:HSP20 family protein